MHRLIFGTYGFDLYIEQLANREMVGGRRTLFTIDQEACIAGRMADIIQPHIAYDTGGFAGVIVTYTEMISLVGRYTGSIRGQPERVTGIGFCNICLDTDIRIVDQP